MKMITLTIDKSAVYAEVSKTTAYSGAKMTDDKDAYDRIFTTDGDRAMLERFWDESCSTATEGMKRFVTTVGDSYTKSVTDDGKTTTSTVPAYVANLELSGSYDEALTHSVEKSLFSYFVNSIVSKWNAFANKGEVELYDGEAHIALQDVLSKLYYKKRPQRVVPQ